MPYAIRLPDGTLVQNIPDDLAPEEAKRRIIAAGLVKAPETTILGQIKEAGKGLIPGAVGLVEQAAIGASALLPEQYETPTREAIAKVAGAAKAPFAAAPGYEETVGRKLGEAIGSTVPFLAAGPLGLAGRLGAVGLGVGAGAGEARTRAEKEGATAEQRALATALGIGPGALEVFAPFRILSRIPEAATAQGVQLVKRALIAGGEEAAQEAASGFAQNLIAKGIYKPDQELIEGLGEQAAYGGATGAIVQGLMDLALGRRARGAVAAPPGAPAAEAPIERAERLAAEKPAPPAAETPALPAPPAEETPAEPPAPPVAETPAPETPAPPIEEPTVRKKGEPPATGMQPADIEALGIAKRQPIYRRLLGKDMDDPAQRDAVLADVEKYLIAGNGSEESRVKLTEFKEQFAAPAAEAAPSQPETLAAEAAPSQPETPSVTPPTTEPEAGGAGAPVVSEPGAGTAPGGVGVVEPSGVVPVGEDVAKPVAGKGTEPVAVTPGPAEAAKPAEPAKPTPAEIVRGEYEPPVKAGLKPERERQLREKLAQQRKELAVLEAARDKAEGNIYLAEITGNEEAKARAIDAYEGARQVLKKAVTAADRTYAQLFDLEKADFEGSVGEAYVAELIAEREAKAKAAREKAPDTTKWPYTLTTAEAVREDVEFELPHSTPEYKAYIEKFFTPSRKLRKGVSEEDAVREGRDLLNRFVLVEARATTGAASEELTTAARNNDTLGALQIIRKMKDATPFDKLVAQRFENLGRYVGLPKIEVVPADQVKGDAQYDSGRDVVQIAEGQVDTHTVQHEIAHAFVHKIIVANEAGQRNDLGYRQLKKLFDHVQTNHPELAGEYGMKSVSEFASEAMSNPEFQRALHKIKYQARTVWEAFTQAVRNLLNLAPGESTALVEAAASVDSLLRAGREFQVRETAGAGTVSVARAITPESEAAAAAADAIGEKEETSLTQKIGQQLAGNKALRLREKFADSLAPVEDFFVNAYGGQVRTAGGRLNPMVLLSRALDALRVSKAVQLEGGLGREDGLIVATELKDAEGRSVSYANILKRIADAAKENKKTYEEYRKTVDNVLYGHREYNLREKNKTLPADEQIELQLGDAEIDALEKAFQQDEFIKQISADLDTIRFNLIDMLVETGRVSAEQAQDYKDATGYIPFQRIGDYDNKWSAATRGANRGVAALKQIRKLEGSKRQSASVIENFSGLVDWATKEAMKNEAASRALEDMVLMGAAKRGPKPAIDSPGGVAEIYENGVKRQFYVPDPAHLVAFSLADPQLSNILKAMQRGAQVLRAGVTAMPPFAIKQVFDDVVRAYTYAGVKNNAELVRNVLTNFPKNWFNEVFRRKDEGIRKMERLGIVGTFDFTQQTNLKNVLEEAGAKKEGLGSTIMRVMEAGAKASDLAVRQAIYDQVMKETGDTAQAESAAREIINFSRRGSSKLMGQMISIIPFFNAYARGMDKLATAAAGKYVGKTTGTARAMFYHRMAVLTAMGFAYALMMQDDDEYNKLPDHVRDTNWVLPYGKELGFTPVIPIPAELAFFFKAIPERIVRYYKYQGTPEERTTMDVLGELTKRGIDVFSSPNITPQVLRPFVENMANYSWFLGRPLESQAQLALRPFERYGTGTSDTMKLIARGLEDVANATGTDIFAISPIKLENAVRGLMGTGAGMMLSFFDAIVNPNRTDRPLHQQLTPQLTGASALMKNAVGTRYMDEIYDLEKRVEQVNGTYNRLLKSDPEGADKFVRDNIGIYAIREPVKGIMDAIRTLNEAAMTIDRDTSLSPEERRKRIDELRAEQNEIARVVFTLRKQARDIQAGR